jgi:hypothetical protein
VKSPLVRLLARLGCTAIAGTFVILIGVQYARIVQRNVDYAEQVRDVQRDVAALQVKREEQLRRIARLSDPHGAIPEIHDRLHLVGDHEAIIYLKRPDGPDGDGTPAQ